MFRSIRRESRKYTRASKTGMLHTYTRYHSIVTLCCDACGREFERSASKMDPRRLNDNCHHVCADCDVKRLAQRWGVESRRIWNMPVDSDADIGRL